MSSQQSQKSLFLDPSYDQSKFRSEFRLPKQNGVYMSNIRLLNIGASKASAGNSSYNELCGALGVIDSIELYSGSQLLDQVRHFSNYVAINNLGNSNNTNQSIHRPLRRNKLGYVATGLDAVDGTTGAITLGVKQNNAVPNEFNALVAATATPEINGAWIDLRDCLGFLRGTSYLPMNVYPDFRVVVNYKQSLTDQIADRTAVLETIRPLLVCEYETDPETADSLMRSYQGHAYECVEHDQIQLPAQAPAQNAVGTQEATFLVKGFNDKYISKVIMVNTPTESSTWDTANVNSSFGNQGSVAQLDWGYQARVNGANVMPRTIYEGKNRRLGQLTDAWGRMNVAGGQNMVNVEGGGAVIFDANAGTTIVDTVGQVDYTAFRIDNVVKEFKLTLQRSPVGGTTGDAGLNLAQRQALQMNIYAISRKRVLPTSNGIVITYV